jgi:hypothetical protein
VDLLAFNPTVLSDPDAKNWEVLFGAPIAHE